ncbi:Hypothetical protein, putative [Bodo saltans]|uniref:Uncharacterized protein n=1 Tax=Bodo saltans TaxID=75058 RepID=A0A0S4J7B2_BODSA|nr:Hypothetical protein, putative [Bodo saltans]|eukprot:CUG86055.1 Hypothetical protein, putative [Bodo saltans]
MRRRHAEGLSVRPVVPVPPSPRSLLSSSSSVSTSRATQRTVATPRVGVASDVVQQFFNGSSLRPTTKGAHVAVRPDVLVRGTRGGASTTSTEYPPVSLPHIPSASPRSLPSPALIHPKQSTQQQQDSAAYAVQRSQFPIKGNSAFGDEVTVDVGMMSKVTLHRAEELMQSYRRRHGERLRVIKEHCSVDMYSDAYDAIDGAEQATLYVNRPITEDDFRQATKQTDFDSRFADMMTLFMHNDLNAVITEALGGSSSPTKKPGSPAPNVGHDAPLDYASLRFVSKQFLEGQEGATEEAKKRTLYKSFRVLQARRGQDDPLAATVSVSAALNEESSPATTAQYASPTRTFSTTGADIGDDDDAVDTWQESDGTDSDDDVP